MKRIFSGLILVIGILAFAESGATLWETLQQSLYAVNWHYIPGRPAGFFKGAEPHGAVLRTFVNDIAYDAIKDGLGTYPDGSVVLKENYDPSGEMLGAITVMKKVKGFDPENGDWFWVKYAAGGKVMAEGKVTGCISCHAQAREQDMVFGAKIK